MTRTRARSMNTAPRDGTVVLLRHGPTQVWVRGFWSVCFEVWIAQDADHPDLGSLHGVTAWRPIL